LKVSAKGTASTIKGDQRSINRGEAKKM